MRKILNILHVKVSKSVLVALVALLWGSAAYRILSIGIINIENDLVHRSIDYILGVAGAVPFFLFVFLKVCRRYYQRIVDLPGRRFGFLHFMSLRGYLMMAFMISMGIISGKFGLIPKDLKGPFYISLGLSLLSSSVFYIYKGLHDRDNLSSK